MKNKLVILFFLCFSLCTCKRETKSNALPSSKTLTISDTSKSKSNNIITLLQTGPPLPPIYENAQDIISKKYNLNFVWAGGCIVNERLSDSIKKFNENSYKELNTFFKRNVVNEINNSLSAEHDYLISLDNYLRATQKKENTVLLIYYVKKHKAYTAYYLFGQPTEKTLQYRIKSVLEIDSATKEIISKTKKDYIQPYNLKDLQND